MVISARSSEHRTELELIEAARLGERDAYEALVAPLRREIHLHCYRMGGSFTDADDMLQETLLKAWRRIDRFEPRAPFRAWLYKIATNTCLNEMAARKRPRFLMPEQWSGGPPVVAEIAHLQPYPDRFLDELADPAAHLARKEEVAIAFIAAIQLLPPRQRAVLILRDVLGWSAKEVADGLDASEASVTSALQRARSTLRAATRGSGGSDGLGPPSEEADQKLLDRFIEMWERADFDGLASVLREDAILAMPPLPMWFRGRADIIGFLSTGPADGHLDRIRLIPLRLNRETATAAYIFDPEDGGYQFYGLMIFTMAGDEVAAITGFPSAELGEHFELPPWLPGDNENERMMPDGL